MDIVVTTADPGLLNASLPTWVNRASDPLRVIVVNASNESNATLRQNFEWLMKGKSKIDFIREDRENGTVIEAMFDGYHSATSEIVAFFHDDLFIFDSGWDLDVRDEFYNYKDLGLLSFGGRRSDGTWVSNWLDAEFFGERNPSLSQAVNYVDGQCLIVRKSFFDKSKEIKGADVRAFHYRYAQYDDWFTCIAGEENWHIRMLPISSYHPGTLEGRKQWRRVLSTTIPGPDKKKNSQGVDFTESRIYLKRRFGWVR